MSLIVIDRIPFIVLLTVYVNEDKPSARELASITHASFTRLLNESLVGFAVRFDDDTYPHIYDRKSGRIWILKTEEGGSRSPDAILSVEERVCLQKCKPLLHSQSF